MRDRTGIPGGSDGKESTCNAGDTGLIPGSGRSPGRGHGNPVQYSCLENPMDRGDWWTTVHSVAKSLTQLKQLSMHIRKADTMGRAEQKERTESAKHRRKSRRAWREQGIHHSHTHVLDVSCPSPGQQMTKEESTFRKLS